MSSTAEQHAGPEEIGRALVRQVEGQLAEPPPAGQPQQPQAPHAEAPDPAAQAPSSRGVVGSGPSPLQSPPVPDGVAPLGVTGPGLTTAGDPGAAAQQGTGVAGAVAAGGNGTVSSDVAMDGNGSGRSSVKEKASEGRGKAAGGTDSDQTESDEDPNEDPEARTARKKLRRACDYCTTKKIRCDGSRPCRQCTKRKVDCRFSHCQRSGPSRSSVQADPVKAAADGGLPPGCAMTPAALAAVVAAATAAGAAVGGAGSPPSVQMATALSGGGITSKVDVTYLNFFLKEFNAFVPLTTQDILRDALNPSPEALRECYPAGDEEYRRQNARVAVIQGCISIGALLKGNTQIVAYLRNVREALTNSFDFVSTETMSAYMVAAYCHDLMGNAAATRNYMEFAKAVATQLPQVTVDHELVFQFYRVCSEVHNCTLSATPKLLQHAGAAAPCYQVLNVLTYALYDLAHLAAEELTKTISKAQVIVELNSLLPILTRADGMSRDNASSFGALGMVLVKGVLAYILVRLGRSQAGLEVLGPVVKLLTDNPGLLRQVMCWHLCHCALVIFLEHGWFKEYETVRGLYNHLLQPPETKCGQHFVVWGRGHYQDAMPYPPVERLHSHGNSFLCSNPICKAINRDLSEGVEASTSAQVVGMPQPVINMVTGEGFLNFDSEAGVNLTNIPNQGASSPRYSLPGFGGSKPPTTPPSSAAPSPPAAAVTTTATLAVPQKVPAMSTPAAIGAMPLAGDVGKKRPTADRSSPRPGTHVHVPAVPSGVPGHGAVGGDVAAWSCTGSAREMGTLPPGAMQVSASAVVPATLPPSLGAPAPTSATS